MATHKPRKTSKSESPGDKWECPSGVEADGGIR